MKSLTIGLLILVVMMQFTPTVNARSRLSIKLDTHSKDSGEWYGYFVANTPDGVGGGAYNNQWMYGEANGDTWIAEESSDRGIDYGMQRDLEYYNYLIIISGNDNGGGADTWDLDVRVYSGDTNCKTSANLDFGGTGGNRWQWALIEIYRCDDTPTVRFAMDMDGTSDPGTGWDETAYNSLKTIANSYWNRSTGFQYNGYYLHNFGTYTFPDTLFN